MTGFRHPNKAALERIYVAQSKTELTYSEVGATKGPMPSGYRLDELVIPLGYGNDLFARSGKFLDDWDLQRAMGFRIHPASGVVADGATVLLSMRILGVALLASCRVVYTVREEGRYGFAYGTLPAHPETGEEYFGVRIDENDQVSFELRAFSRPTLLLARLGGPVSRIAQKAAIRGYGEKMKEFANKQSD